MLIAEARHGAKAEGEAIAQENGEEKNDKRAKRQAARAAKAAAKETLAASAQ